MAAPLTTGDLATVVSRLTVLGMPRLADWLHADPEQAETPQGESVCRDVLGLTPGHLGYGHPPGTRTAAAIARVRRATRTALLITWATDPWYADTDDQPDDDRNDE